MSQSEQERNAMLPAGYRPRRSEILSMSPDLREALEMLIAVALHHDEITTSRAQEILGTPGVRAVRDILAYWRDALPLLTREDEARLTLLAQPELQEMVGVVREAGPAQWNTTAPLSAEEHGAEFARMVRETTEQHGLSDEPRPVHWLSVKDGLSLAFVGSSPNSPHLARALCGAWNRLVQECGPPESDTP